MPTEQAAAATEHLPVVLARRVAAANRARAEGITAYLEDGFVVR
ncbi:hypothetical protein ACIA8C_38370 [Nocardia sp. NPDC051321]